MVVHTFLAVYYHIEKLDLFKEFDLFFELNISSGVTLLHQKGQFPDTKGSSLTWHYFSGRTNEIKNLLNIVLTNLAKLRYVEIRKNFLSKKRLDFVAGY